MKIAKKASQAPKFNSEIPPVPVGSYIGFIRPMYDHEKNRVFKVLGCQVPPPDEFGFTSPVKMLALEAVDTGEVYYQDSFIFFADRWKKHKVAQCTPDGVIIKAVNKPPKIRRSRLDFLCENYASAA